MSKRSIAAFLILGAAMTFNFAGSTVWSANACARSVLGNREDSVGAQPQITQLQVLYKGQLADQLITGNKAKRYTIDLRGSGFDPASSVLIDDRRVPTTFVSSTELTARLRGNLTSAPRELMVTVVNPDAQISNALILDVISNPADLSIFTLSTDVATSGTQIKVSGVGFTPTGNRLKFRRVAQPGLTGLTTDLPSGDGRIITLDVPVTVCPPCFYATPPCLVPCLSIIPGDYQLSVVNANGISNSVRFLVSSADGPIGVWGGDHIRVEVSDLQVRVTGLCFSGVTEQTVHLDSNGRFDLVGEIFVFVGPAGLPHPARYLGSIAGNLMTLVVEQTDSMSSFGPYTLVFGNDVHVVHPCL